MRPPLGIRQMALAVLLMAAVFDASLVPARPADAASGPSLSYTVTAQAYNNTLKVAKGTDMLAPRIAVGPDPTGNGSVDVYVLGIDSGSCGNLVTIRSTDGGRSYGIPAKAALCLSGEAVDALVTANGTLIALAAGPKAYRSFDGGSTWTSPSLLDTSGAAGTIARDAVTGGLYAAWGNLVSVSVDSGATWSNKPIQPPISSSVTEPSVAAYGGHVVVAFTDWAGDTPSGPFGHETTAVVTSADNGSTWSNLADLAPRGSAYRVGAPSAAVSGRGVFGVTWPVIALNTTTWILVSGSRDGGSTWSPAFPATAGGEIFVPPPFGRSSVFDSDGRLSTTWHGFPGGASFSISVAGSDANLTTFAATSFTIRFQTGVVNSTGTENLAADNASRVFLVWEVPAAQAPDDGVFVRTVTGVATGDVKSNGTVAPATATVSLRSAATGSTVRQVTWSGSSFLLPELPPDVYQVWIDTGNGSAFAGSMPVRPWSDTAFTVHVAGGHVGPPPPTAPFPWLLAGFGGGVVAALGAALAAVHYTRLTRETVLQRKVRLLLYEYVRDNPGVSFAAVRDALALQNGAVAYHLTVLEKQGFLHSESKGRHHFYYPNGDASLWRDLPLSELQTSIVQAVRTTPGIGLRELGRAIGREPSSVGYNVKALAREGLLRTDRDGLRLRCYPAEAIPSA